MIKVSTESLFHLLFFSFFYQAKKGTHLTVQLHKIQLFFLFKDLELSLTGKLKVVLTNIHYCAKLIKNPSANQ
jgi:hypothetical protein